MRSKMCATEGTQHVHFCIEVGRIQRRGGGLGCISSVGRLLGRSPRATKLCERHRLTPEHSANATAPCKCGTEDAAQALGVVWAQVKFRLPYTSAHCFCRACPGQLHDGAPFLLPTLSARYGIDVSRHVAYAWAEGARRELFRGTLAVTPANIPPAHKMKQVRNRSVKGAFDLTSTMKAQQPQHHTAI